MIDEKVFASCKKGVRIVNVARGGVIKDSALLAALESGQVAGAALDVFENEPPINDAEWGLIKHPKVIQLLKVVIAILSEMLIFRLLLRRIWERVQKKLSYEWLQKLLNSLSIM